MAIGEPAVDALVAILEDPAIKDEPNYDLLQSGAMRALGGIGNPQAVLSIMRIVENDEDHKKPGGATVIAGLGSEALGNLKDTRAVPILVKVVSTTKDRQVAVTAGRALSKIDGPEGRDGLIEIMKHRELEFRLFSVLRLMDIGTEKGGPRILEALQEQLEVEKGDPQMKSLFEEAIQKVKEGEKSSSAVPSSEIFALAFKDYGQDGSAQIIVGLSNDSQRSFHFQSVAVVLAS